MLQITLQIFQFVYHKMAHILCGGTVYSSSRVTNLTNFIMVHLHNKLELGKLVSYRKISLCIMPKEF